MSKFLISYPFTSRQCNRQTEQKNSSSALCECPTAIRAISREWKQQRKHQTKICSVFFFSFSFHERLNKHRDFKSNSESLLRKSNYDSVRNNVQHFVGCALSLLLCLCCGCRSAPKIFTRKFFTVIHEPQHIPLRRRPLKSSRVRCFQIIYLFFWMFSEKKCRTM